MRKCILKWIDVNYFPEVAAVVFAMAAESGACCQPPGHGFGGLQLAA